MTESLFGASPTIGFADNAEDTYSMATRVAFASDGTITGVRFWGTTNAPSTSYSAAIYSTAGVLQVSKAFSAPHAAGAWNTVMLDTPFPVTAGQTWDVVVGPRNRYAGNGSTFPRTSGSLTGTAGRFVVGPSLAWPTTAGGGGATWYGIDLLFEPGSAGSETVAFAGTGPLPALSSALQADAQLAYSGAGLLPTVAVGLGAAAEATFAGTAPAPALTSVISLPVDSLLHPNAEQVAVAYLKGLMGVSHVATSLPGRAADGTYSWSDDGFIQVRAMAGGTPDGDVPVRVTVFQVDFWAVSASSGKPPWNKAAQLGENLWHALLDDPEAVPRRVTTMPAAYHSASVHWARLLSEPRRIPNDSGDFAHYVADLELRWREDGR